MRTLELDGKALLGKGIELVEVNGKGATVTAGPVVVGPTSGKRRGVTGPYNQVMHRPWLYVYPDGSEPYMAYAAYLVSSWNLIGNGHTGALPRSQVTPSLAADFNLVWLGVARNQIPQIASDLPFDWDDAGVTLKGSVFPGQAILSVFDAGDRVGAVLHAPKGKESLLYGVVPFSSRAGLPDYLVWGSSGATGLGFCDGDWQWEPKFGQGF